MKYCSGCGAENADNATNCEKCGKPFEQPTVQQQPETTYQQTVVVQQAAPVKKNGMAVAGLVMGILSIVFSWFYISYLFVLLGIIFSSIGIARSKTLGRKGMAIAGLVLSLLDIILATVLVITVVGVILGGASSLFVAPILL